MHIDVSGYQFVFPSQCACCGDPPDTTWTVSAYRHRGTRVRHTTIKQWDIPPYCRTCVAHATRYTRALAWAFGMGLLGFVLAMNAQGMATTILFIATIVVAVAVFSLERRFADAARKGACGTTKPAVRYLGWQGTVHRFDLSSPYAMAFLTENHAKVVNAPPELQHLLAQVTPAGPRNVQRARRYER